MPVIEKTGWDAPDLASIELIVPPVGWFDPS
jgi:hypothetical protein